MSFSSSKLSARLSNPYLLEAVILILLLLTTVFINLRMIRDGINGMTDQRWHILWIQHFSKQMAEGIWYPRWLAGTNYGYGSPTFVFYPPLVYYLGSFFRFIGLNIQQTVTALFSLALFLSGLNFYIYGRSRWGAIPATVGALVYMSAPYLAFNMYWIGSLSVAFAIPWIPLIWWLTEKAIAQPSWRIGLALSWTILALTHLPSLLLCGIVWLFHTLFFLLDRSWQSVVATLITAGIGLGIASFFLLPTIVEQPLVNIEAMASVGGGFKNIMLGSSRLPLIPLRFDLFIPQLFVQQLFAIATFGAIFFFFLRQDKAIAPEARYWLIFALVLAFLMTSWSWPIWKASSTLQKVQAPWRLLHLFSFFGAALSAVLVTGILKFRSRLRLLLSLIIVGILLTNLGYAYKLSRKFPTFNKPGQANLEHLKPAEIAIEEPFAEKLIDVSEYRPSLANGNPSPDPQMGEPKLSLIDGKASVSLQEWSSYERIFQVTAEETSRIRIRTYYYPAWHLYVNDRPHQLDRASDGTMELTLKPGSYTAQLRYQSTGALKVGIILSVLSLVVLILFYSKSSIKSYK